MIRDCYPHVRLIESPENLGFSKGNNLGIRQAKGRYIALANPDVVVLPGCLDALADFLDQNPRVGDVGPRVLNPDGTIQSSCQRFPTLWNSLCSALGLASRFRNSKFFAGQDLYCLFDERPLAVEVIVGCFSMIRRETFEDVGLLDEELFMYADDVDWCRRAWKKRWQVMFYPGAQAIHDRSSITAPYPVRFALERQRSTLHYWKKHHGSSGALAVRMIMFVHHLLRYAFAMLEAFVRTEAGVRCRARKHVSCACLRELLLGKI
jgi:GT2 family glycosyltransferase